MITILLIIMDFIWCFTMRSVWANKPINNKTNWPVFDYLRTFTLILSFVNIGVKGVIVMFLIKLKGSKNELGLNARRQ